MQDKDKLVLTQCVQKYPQLRNADFLLVLKKRISKNKYHHVILSKGYEDTWIVRPHRKQSFISVKDIRLNGKYKDLEDCVESYILVCLDKGYEIIFCQMDVHRSMWQYIDDRFKILHSLLNETIIKYLSYCRRQNVTSALLNRMYGTSLHDLTKLFFPVYELKEKMLMQRVKGDIDIQLVNYFPGSNEPFTVICRIHRVKMILEFRELTEALDQYKRFSDMSISEKNNEREEMNLCM